MVTVIPVLVAVVCGGKRERRDRSSLALTKHSLQMASIKRPSTSTSTSTSTAKGKRVKFDPDSTAAPLDLDDTEALEGDLSANKKKAKVVLTDGYDSDSSAGSDDGFGIGGGRKGSKKAGKKGGGGDEQEDDDDDMFGGDDDDDDDDDTGTKKKTGGAKGKGKEFLEMGDIEGQEFGKGDDEEDEDARLDGRESVVKEVEDEEDYLEEDDLANDDDAPRTSRNKASMGYKLS